ncbi:MAG: ABC transporter ATP-binding protein [Geminicoccaceae bacterium]|nr:ABC transporter ATP-binding protein [Geminicoccaceae bacterium]MCS7268769.1 ABC transporter ATP-binding protein [Geminicoccaceae bacterium]MDW8125683.1 ABC transporter ATP-binding protein [Geminicoccaceae bacterium]MDW8340531.1 ABC transporter ATP-binding protein [Geminicoccaceae bacterium]
MTASAPVLRLVGIRRSFLQGTVTLEVLKGVDLELEAGTLAALVGPSGSGKSTLLHIAGLLERPSAGEVVIEGRAAGDLSDAERTRLRRARIGFVYQFHNLLADFSALENVVLPQLLAGVGWRAAEARARALLARLGLAERLHHRPGRLSGGEQQRVAIARALANRPALLLADEPTGNLDPHTAEEVFALLLEVVREAGAAVLIVTHDAELARRTDRIWRLVEGRVEPVPS